jgi:hypothetical protein
MKFYHRKTMEVKFSVSGPAIGGAKPESIWSKRSTEKVFYNVGISSFSTKSYYGTGGDQMTKYMKLFQWPKNVAFGIHRKVFNGHFKPTKQIKSTPWANCVKRVVKVIENPKYSNLISKKYSCWYDNRLWWLLKPFVIIILFTAVK